MTLSGASTIRVPVCKVSSRLAGSCCSRGALHNTSKRYQSTVSALTAPPKPQLQPGQRESLLHLLRPHVAKRVSLNQREDAYVSVTDLLNHPEFRHLDIGSLQELTDRDEKYRFSLQYDANSEKEHWWVRAKKWNEPHTVQKPVVSQYGIPHRVLFTTTLKKWHSHISRIGIPKPRDEDIEFACHLNGPTLDNLEREVLVYVYLNLALALKAGIRFYSRSATSDARLPSHIYTAGDEYGFIPLEFFRKVEIVRVKKTLLWGNAEPLKAPPVRASAKEFIKEDETMPFLRDIEHAYQNLGSAPVQAQAHGKTMEEAHLAVNW